MHCAVAAGRHACQLHRSEIGQGYTVTASLSDLSTMCTALRSAHGLFIPLKDAVESYKWHLQQLQATAICSQLYLPLAADRRHLKSAPISS